MSKSNTVLLAVFVVVAVVWFVRRDGGDEAASGPAPRLFPEINEEAVAGIHIEGGWKGFPYRYERGPTGWVLASAGGYPVQKDVVEEFIGAVAALRRDNLVGGSDDLKKASRTGEDGRKVTILHTNGEPMAEFMIGKHPKGEWQSYFIRRANESDIYRTKTVTGEEPESAQNPFPGMGGSRGFDWAQHANNSRRFVSTDIWNLDDGEVREVWLERPGDGFKARIVREEAEKWSLVAEDGSKEKADTAAVEDITNRFSYLSFEEVVGAFEDEDARKKYGLDKPVITLVLTLRREIEKEDDEAGEEESEGEEKEGEENGEGNEEDKEPSEPEYETYTRTITVGAKVKLPVRFDDEKEEAEEQEYYAIKVSGELKDAHKSDFIYLVNDYQVGPLKKTLDELRVKEEEKDEEKEPADEEKKPDGDGEPKPAEDEAKPDGEKAGPGETKTDEPKGDEPKADDPKAEDPKTDDPKAEDPKADEPKTEDPKAENPKTEDPKTEDPKTEDPKTEDPKTEDPKTEDPKGDG